MSSCFDEKYFPIPDSRIIAQPLHSGRLTVCAIEPKKVGKTKAMIRAATHKVPAIKENGT
jgi:hypothetical protein